MGTAATLCGCAPSLMCGETEAWGMGVEGEEWRYWGAVLGCRPRCPRRGMRHPLLVARCVPGSAGAGTALGTEGLPQGGHGAQHRWLAATQMAICITMVPFLGSPCADRGCPFAPPPLPLKGLAVCWCHSCPASQFPHLRVTAVGCADAGKGSSVGSGCACAPPRVTSGGRASRWRCVCCPGLSPWAEP